MGSLRDLTTAHRDAVASGEATIASVADSLGLARQSVWRGFKRRKWATTATLPPELPPISAPPPLAPLLPVPSPPIACVIDESQVAAVAPAVLANSLVLLLARTERLLSDPERLGPSALRQCAATLDTTLAIMERLGLRQAGDEQNSVLLIEAMTEAEVEQIRATQEVEYSSAFPDHAPNDDADGLDDAPDSPTVGRGGAASAISAPTTILGHRPEPTALGEASVAPQSPIVETADLDRLEARLRQAAGACGARFLRQQAIEAGLQGDRDAEVLVRRLLAAARRDHDLVGRLIEALASLGVP